MLRLERLFDLRVEVPQRVRDCPRPSPFPPVACDIHMMRLGPCALGPSPALVIDRALFPLCLVLATPAPSPCSIAC